MEFCCTGSIINCGQIFECLVEIGCIWLKIFERGPYSGWHSLSRGRRQACMTPRFSLDTGLPRVGRIMGEFHPMRSKGICEKDSKNCNHWYELNSSFSLSFTLYFLPLISFAPEPICNYISQLMVWKQFSWLERAYIYDATLSSSWQHGCRLNYLL